MTKLLTIQNTAQAIAEAISAAIEIETEIVDNRLNIVAGTGRYYEKIGKIEEEGDINSGEIYGLVLRTGKEYIIEDAINNPIYLGRENELAEVCFPIRMENQIIGLIGLVAFTQEQKNMLINKQDSLLNFTRKMAFLLASRVAEVQISNAMETILESIHDGILSVDNNGIIISCNIRAEKLIGKSKEELVGNHLKEFWPDSSVMDVIRTGVGYTDKEEIFTASDGKQLHFISTVSPIHIRKEKNGCVRKNKCNGAVISFRDIKEIKKMLYDMTEKNPSSSIDEFLGESAQIHNLKDRVQKIANGNSTVLITGESGTGKTLLAKSIHFASSRKEAPFVTVNCGAIPDNLIESELFGYEPGAFTGAKKNGKPGKFELADKGTIFLDEIGDMPLHLQVKLLNVLQQHKFERIGGTREISVDIRVIAATNLDLEQMVVNGEFREDLYFRLNVIPINIPPLRERKEDVRILLEHSLNKYNNLLNKEIDGFDDNAMELLLNYSWPGNVRELENAIEYTVNMEEENKITVNSLPPKLKHVQKKQTGVLPLEIQCRQLEKKIIVDCLEKTGCSVEGKIKAADLLGISVSTLYRKIRELNIEL